MLCTTPEKNLCKRCRQTILVAWSDGLAIRAELRPVRLSVELALLMEGRITYSHTGSELVRRDADRICDPRLAEMPIHTSHICSRPLPAAFLAPPPVPSGPRGTDAGF